jgi:hypothetical protein
MGEAKGRQGNYRFTSNNDPKLMSLLEKGQPINCWLIGAGYLMPKILAEGRAWFIAPEQHVFRYAFSTYNRVMTGEIDPWHCFLCQRKFSGLGGLSTFAMLERSIGNPAQNKPAVAMMICHECDSVSTEETQRRVERAYGMIPVQEGLA